MNNKETIYNALGVIEGAICVSEKNTRDTLKNAVNKIKTAIENEDEQEQDLYDRISEVCESTEDKEKRISRLACEVMREIYKNDRTGKLLYHFVKYLRKYSLMYAYRGSLDSKYKFVIMTEDEYNKMKD